MSRPDEFARARADFDALTNTNPYEAARRYVARWPNHPPDAFYDSGRKRRDFALTALNDGDGWASQLAAAAPDLHLYSLHARHLGLPPEAADPARFLTHDGSALWRRSIRTQLGGPLYWKLELGDAGTHAHVLTAGDAGLSELPHGGEVVKPVTDLFGVLCYLGKPKMRYTAEHLALRLEAERRGRLPKLSGPMRLPRRRVWSIPSASVIHSVLPTAAAAAAGFRDEARGDLGDGQRDPLSVLPTAAAAAAAPQPPVPWELIYTAYARDGIERLEHRTVGGQKSARITFAPSHTGKTYYQPC